MIANRADVVIHGVGHDFEYDGDDDDAGNNDAMQLASAQLFLLTTRADHRRRSQEVFSWLAFVVSIVTDDIGFSRDWQSPGTVYVSAEALGNKSRRRMNRPHIADTFSSCWSPVGRSTP